MNVKETEAEDTDGFEPWDHGYRRGVFDKCNGREKMSTVGYDLDNLSVSMYFDGYEDGWSSNERRI